MWRYTHLGIFRSLSEILFTHTDWQWSLLCKLFYSLTACREPKPCSWVGEGETDRSGGRQNHKMDIVTAQIFFLGGRGAGSRKSQFHYPYLLEALLLPLLAMAAPAIALLSVCRALRNICALLLSDSDDKLPTPDESRKEKNIYFFKSGNYKVNKSNLHPQFLVWPLF